MAQIKPENLVGRQVYFKMSKRQFAKESIKEPFPIRNLTPNKLYTIVDVDSKYSNLFSITNDGGSRILLAKDCCAHLNDKTGWILKRRTK